jgi:hypothetical protein
MPDLLTINEVMQLVMQLAPSTLQIAIERKPLLLFWLTRIQTKKKFAKELCIADSRGTI